MMTPRDEQPDDFERQQIAVVNQIPTWIMWAGGLAVTLGVLLLGANYSSSQAAAKTATETQEMMIQVTGSLETMRETSRLTNESFARELTRIYGRIDDHETRIRDNERAARR
jgi:hypothetical protein